MESEKRHRFEAMLEHVVLAIHSVVNVEVTIVDAKYRRLAATGLYACQIGERINEKSAFAMSMREQKAYFIESPGDHPVCLACEGRVNCCETAEVCCPILLEGESVGAIGLIAFNEEQREALMNKQSYLLPFLESMSNLIAAKVKEMRQGEELKLLTDAVEHPLFAMSNDGQILRTNEAAQNLWQLSSKEGSTQIEDKPNLVDLFGSSALEKICSGESVFQVQLKNGNQSFELKARAIEADQQYVVILKPLKEMIGYANRYLSNFASTSFSDILGEHIKMAEAKAFALRAAKSSATILVLGESGTGKELFARAIHQASERRKQVFLAINCAAIPESLMESELFGYEEGTFTGSAKGGRIGRFEQAHKGTLFLDEIGDMPLHLQAKLLRVLQEGRITRLGGRKEIPVDVRIIAATHRNLDQMVKEGAFREDLYYRINVLPIELPSLRERSSDILLLAEAFVRKSSAKLDKAVDGLSEEVAKVLATYGWPGNVRELENTIEYMVHMATSKTLTPEDLPKKLRVIEVGHSLLEQPDLQTEQESYHLEGLERRALSKVIDLYGKDQEGIKNCCKALGISRATFYRKVQLYGL